jgi:ABC-2 type transport system permease protein
MRSILSFIVRISSFIRKEIVAILRQPRLVFSLILGPFLILLVFGVGYRDQPKELDTLFVVSEESQVAGIIEQYADNLGETINFVGITNDAADADRRLRQQEVDLVVVTPPDPMAEISNNQQSVFYLYHYEIDPFEETYVRVLGEGYADEVNRQVLMAAADQGKLEAQDLQTRLATVKETAASVRQALEAGQTAQAQQSAETLSQDVNLLSLAVGSGLAIFSGLQQTVASADGVGGADGTVPLSPIQERLESIQANLESLRGLDAAQTDVSSEAQTAAAIEQDLTELDTMLTEFMGIDSQVLVTPFRSETLSITNQAIGPTDYFVPAVIALLLQHIAITLAGLSIVREQQSGAMELFRAAPVSAFETLLGKYISYLLLTGALAAILTVLVIFILRVPMLGEWGNYALVVFVLLCASLGVGFFISLAANSDSQAIQYAMIILLASIFFSGFFLALYRLWEPVRVVSWALPATYGINMLQSVMLRGIRPNTLLLLGFAVYALFFFLLSWWRLGKVMARQ